MSDLTTLLKPKKIMVIGDVMVDHYTYGKVTRISPEAPVPVLHVSYEQKLPGGAGNVMSNLVALGMEVIALSRVGSDSAGESCRELLNGLRIGTEALFVDPSFQTPIKNRMIADNQQIVRVDYEKKREISQELEQKALAYIASILPELDAITISDYDKGLCTTSLLQAMMQQAQEAGVAVIADPKGMHFEKYKGATLLKPNLSEAIRAAKLPEEASLDHVAQKILTDTFCKYLMITRSEAGISLFDVHGRQDFPAKIQNVRDVTGAGDTVCAVIVSALANRMPLELAVPLANKAASYVVQQVGCVAVSLEKLLL